MNGCLFRCVSPAIDWWPVQGELHLLPCGNWDMLQSSLVCYTYVWYDPHVKLMHSAWDSWLVSHFTLCFGIKSSSPWTFYNYLISKPEWHFIFLKFQWKLYWSHRVQWCVCCDLDPLQPCAKPTLTNLGVKLWFILDTQIKSIIKATFYHLRLLSKHKSTFKLWTFHLCFCHSTSGLLQCALFWPLKRSPYCLSKMLQLVF